MEPDTVRAACRAKLDKTDKAVLSQVDDDLPSSFSAQGLDQTLRPKAEVGCIVDEEVEVFRQAVLQIAT